MIGKEKMFWVDKIEDIINRTSERILKIRLKKKENFKLLNNINKIKAVNRIKSFCKNASAKQKEKTIKDLIRLCKVKPINKYSKNYRVMSWKQVRKIASNDLFEIGGHSLNHDILTKLTSSQMKKDVKNSIKILKNKLNSKVIHYSYPEGQISDYNKNIKIYLKSLGIKFCPTAVHGISSINDDEFETKRIMVGINDQKFPFKKFYN